MTGPDPHLVAHHDLPPPPARLVTKIAELLKQGPVMNHGVWWLPQRWEDQDLGRLGSRLDAVTGASVPGDDGWNLIRRCDVAGLTDPATQFLAAMVWGFGTVSYGPSRVARIASDGGERLISSIEVIQAAARSGAAEAWDAFTVTHKLRWLGPAFATKVAYFASLADDQPGTGPLIADMNTSWAMWDLVELPRSVERRDRYLDYVRMAGEWARQLDCRPDDVECALFELGKKVPRPNSRRRRRS